MNRQRIVRALRRLRAWWRSGAETGDEYFERQFEDIPRDGRSHFRW